MFYFSSVQFIWILILIYFRRLSEGRFAERLQKCFSSNDWSSTRSIEQPPDFKIKLPLMAHEVPRQPRIRYKKHLFGFAESKSATSSAAFHQGGGWWVFKTQDFDSRHQGVCVFRLQKNSSLIRIWKRLYFRLNVKHVLSFASSCSYIFQTFNLGLSLILTEDFQCLNKTRNKH